MNNEENSTASKDSLDKKAIEMIKASGLLNPNFTLDKIMDLSAEIVGAGGIHTDAESGTFVTAGYVYTYQK